MSNQNAKLMLELRKKHAFTFHMREDEGKWVGQVWRFPHPLQQQTAWGQPCGTTCQADSEDGLRRQLNAIINEYDK